MPRLLLVVADIPSQRRRLTRAVLERCEREQRPVQVVDLTADLNLAGLPPSLQRCETEVWADQIWQQLAPPLGPWLALLELDTTVTERPPTGAVPGLDTVLRALFLAECWHNLPDGTSLLVVLPPPAQAVEILQLLRRGPDLLEGLWKPLLAWWGVTRQRLAQFELVLRLRLPTAESLELSPDWRSRLQQLADRLSDPTNPVEAFLGMAAEGDDLPFLDARVAALPLCGISHLRVWLEARLPKTLLRQLGEQWQLPLLIAPADESGPDFSTWLERPLPTDPLLWMKDSEGSRCRLFLPGVGREGLQVRQQEQQLLIRWAGLRLEVPLPQDWAQLSCRSARVEAPWLELGFS